MPDPSPATILLLSRGGELDGAQRQLAYLAANLDPARFRPLVLLDSDGPLLAELRRQNVDARITPMHYWRRFPDALSRYPDAFRIATIARTARARLVHASDLWKSPYALFAARRLHIPCVLHVRGPMTTRDIIKHGMPRAAAVIAIARRYTEDLTRAAIPPARIHEIDDAVDTDHFRHDPAGRQKIRRHWNAADHTTVGLVGRIEPFKQIVEFLEAIARLPAPLLDATRFLIIGQDGPPAYMQRVHETVARLALHHRVSFTGRCDDMPAVLSALDLLVSLSGGSVLFEAMACGTPVLSARNDARLSLHTRHDQTAWCLTSTAPPDVAAALQTLLADPPLRHRLAAAGRDWVRHHLPVSTLATKTQALYKTLLTPRPLPNNPSAP